MFQPLYPPPDDQREQRIISDVISLMKLRNDEQIKTMVQRWLSFTLVKAQRFNRLPWWFARRMFSCMVYRGQDVFDLQGEIDRIITISCPFKLQNKPIDLINDRRQEALFYGNCNAGKPEYYSIHGGRLHLWPCPDKTYMIIINYSYPLKASIVPPEWENFLVDGIIGLYGRHFDSSGLLENADEFVTRFYEGLKTSRAEHFDTQSYNLKDHVFLKTKVMSHFQAYAELASPSFESDDNPIIKPAYDSIAGEIQILADKDYETDNQRHTPVAQIRGDDQP